jgi:hypothetical protein
MRPSLPLSLILILALCTPILPAAEKPPFRTDADGPVLANEKKTKNPKDRGAGEKPAWYALVAGEFPPSGSEHAITGELISVDHLDRNFRIRVDRGDHQERGVFDRPLYASLLPYASVWYHGQPAALQDIPLGTHLRGLFYLKDPSEKTPSNPGPFDKGLPTESEFQRCLRLEDDFTFHARQNQLWKIDSVDLETLKLTATLQSQGTGGKPGAPLTPKTFDLQKRTRVFKGAGFADLSALAAGQTVLFNLTWATLYGAGRITDLWIDEQSRAMAGARQLEVHRQHLRERGLPGWITAVDDAQQMVTVIFFGGIDTSLFEEITIKDPNAPPPRDGSPPPEEPIGRLAVALESLMTYDPVNDSKRASVMEVKKIPAEPGSSGVQVRLKMEMMLEGYRPRRLVRFYPPTWKVIALPKEEEFSGRE